MKYLKKFNEDILEERSVKGWCNYFNLINFTINNNGTVDVNGFVRINEFDLIKIPIQFGIIYGNFYCSSNGLTTLEGSPKEVGGNFYCNVNNLITLEGGPKIIDGDYWCSQNDLISLEGSPDELSGGLYCLNNPIYEIYKLFGNYKAYRDSLDYNYLRGDKIIKLRFKEALEEAGVEIPRYILYYEYI